MTRIAKNPDVAIMQNGKILCVIKGEEKPAPKPRKKTSKKLEKYLDNTAAKHPNGEILKETVLHDMKTSKCAPHKGSPIEGVDINKEFQKALDKGKKYGMHLSNKGDHFLTELDKLASFDPLNGKN